MATTGHVRTVGRLQAAVYELREETVKYFLADFVRQVRSISPDPVVVRRNWERAYALVTTRAANTLSAYAREVDPFGKIGRVTVTVEIANILAMSTRSYQVEWVERIFNGQGEPVDTTRYSGIFHVLIRRPEDAALLDVNPLGLFIDAFTWTRRRA